MSVLFPPLGNEISFANAAELADIMLRIDFVEGYRPTQSSTFRERYTVCQYLLTLASRKALRYPVAIKNRETPDLIWISCNTEIGMEITEGTSEQLRSGLARHKIQDSGRPFYPSQYSRRSFFRGGWVGQDAEIEFVELMLEAVYRKINSYSTTQRPFGTMELLIYSFTPGGSGIEDDGFEPTRNLIVSKLNEQDPENEIGQVFQAVHVVYGSNVIVDFAGNPKYLVPPHDISWSLLDRENLRRQLHSLAVFGN